MRWSPAMDVVKPWRRKLLQGVEVRKKHLPIIDRTVCQKADAFSETETVSRFVMFEKLKFDFVRIK